MQEDNTTPLQSQQLPQQSPQPAGNMVDSNGFQSMIPTKNVPSLVSYYCGVFSFIPVVGFVLGIVGLIFGFKALAIVKQRPTPGAKVHAIIGIVLSLIFLFIHTGVILLIIASANS